MSDYSNKLGKFTPSADTIRKAIADMKARGERPFSAMRPTPVSGSQWLFLKRHGYITDDGEFTEKFLKDSASE